MAPSKTNKSAPKDKKESARKEKIFHPQSRKAGQLARTQLRKDKLASAASKRAKKHASHVDLYGFFYHAMPPTGVFTLQELHEIIRDVWLTRHDAALDQERAQRRPGRPKSTGELKLEEIKLRETEEYRTGMEVPDLTDPANVALFRAWDQVEFAYIQLLRFIRISGAHPDKFIVTRPGKHVTLNATPSVAAAAGEVQDAPMEDSEQIRSPPSRTNSFLAEPPERFSSTIMYMDGS
ncbi:hypothetical protein PUNSTDRAFT_101382 [Punctularia strigosozonata HHB-11173 SS5]|uniref:uncharacterized protein n=1 Tax=Punctularia strigosozonata (strain HHB-11173) TaxID=741275 RepID=UPI0004417CA2|nr:uncharacterized protein PUNSTDRAFT_101382 [Punctularia strigosozonata HHB-11173 SS5]EIN09527.1 hypothetical protein PUNSTDRAFT_101382 [Punctularia strigosozonata HHB-11173 SS5]